MKRMQHWIFNIAAGVSLLLLGLTIGFSVHAIPRSFFGIEPFSWGNMELASGYSLQAIDGKLAFQIASGFQGLPSDGIFTLVQSGSGFDLFGIHHHRWLSNAMTRNHVPLPNVHGSMEEFAVSVIWPIAFFSILPVFWLMRWILDRPKRLPGHCRICGYDLRATPEQCPECGTIPLKNKIKSK